MSAIFQTMVLVFIGGISQSGFCSSSTLHIGSFQFHKDQKWADAAIPEGSRI